MNRNVKILSRRLYWPSLKDVAWLERVQFIFLIFHTFDSKFGGVEAGRRGKNLQTKKNWKINSASSIQPTIFNLGEYNLLLSILTVRFINCVKLNFGKSYLPSDSHTNTVISSDRKTVIRPIFLALHAQWILVDDLQKGNRRTCKSFYFAGRQPRYFRFHLVE